MPPVMAQLVSLLIIGGLIAAGCRPQAGRPGPADATAAVGPSDASDPAALPAPAETVEIVNPYYQDWMNYAVGTTVRHREVHSHATNRTESIKTQRLVQLTDNLCVVEMRTRTTYPDGRVDEPPAMRHQYARMIRVPKGTDPASIGRGGTPLERGRERVVTPAGTFEAEWYTLKGRVEAGDILHKIWTSPTVPGKVVRVESRVPALGSETVEELIEVQVPKGTS